MYMHVTSIRPRRVVCIPDRNSCIVVVAAIGFNVETVQYNNIKFQVWDLGSCREHRIFLFFIYNLVI